MLESILSVVSSFGDVFLSCLLYYIVLRPLGKNISRSMLLILLAINLLPTLILTFSSVYFLIKSLIAFIIDIVTCYILSNHRFGISFCLPTIYFGLLYLCESTATFVLALCYPSVTAESVLGTSFFQIYGTLESRGLLYLILGSAIYIIRRKTGIGEPQYLHASQWVCFGAGLALLASFVTAFSYSQNKDPQWMNHIAPILPIVFALQLIIMLALFINMSRGSEREYKLQSELLRADQREEQSKTIRSLYEKSRAIRHDFKNHMQVLGTLAEEGRLEEIKKYLKEMADSEPLSTRQWIEVRDPTVAALVNAKFSRALESGIRISAEIWYPNPMHVPTADLCTVLFNVLDNAIEACEKNKDPENRRIRLVLKQKGYFFGVLCDNPSEIAPIPAKKYRFRSTKKGPFHGIGLRQLSQMAHKHNGAFDAKYEKGIFSVRVVMANSPCSESFISTVELPYKKPEKVETTCQTE